MSCVTLHCITGKVFVQIGSHFGSIPWKMTQNRFKMVAMLTLEGLSNENQNWWLQETYLGYVTLWGLSFGAAKLWV